MNSIYIISDLWDGVQCFLRAFFNRVELYVVQVGKQFIFKEILSMIMIQDKLLFIRQEDQTYSFKSE